MAAVLFGNIISELIVTTPVFFSFSPRQKQNGLSFLWGKMIWQQLIKSEWMFVESLSAHPALFTIMENQTHYSKSC